MDPVTAFGLAAGVLQVVDLSFKVLSKCREIYTEGSLAENRSTEEITKYLGETTDRLKTAVQNAPSARSQDSTDIIDISTKCSKTAEELLTELAKMRIEVGGGRRQAITKAFRATRRKKFIADSQQKLETYQRLLDTRILARLNSHSVQQAKDFQSLDHGVKDLAAALDQGRNTVAQILADHSLGIREHLDRRLNENAQADQKSKAHARFKDSLFYPEIYSRQDDIPSAHEGTCRWIFVDGDYNGNRESHPWPSLVDWFKHGMSSFLNLNNALSNAGKGDEPYWLSGKPGSGKSTLMKYISNECRSHIKKEDTSSSDMVVASFFFWNSGSALQKSLVGFLRSLLYQIANQQPDLIPVMDDTQADSTTTPNTSFRQTEPFAWTEQRLSMVLRRTLAHMAPSIDLYFFIDGLDEFVGDEDDLIALVRLMHQTPRVKVCVSSRPEQVFRLGFAQSPQIRLQDLNYLDMKKTVEDTLHPILNRHFPEQETDIEILIDDIVRKAQGVFLWLELTTKSLRKGCYNADTIRELHEKLDRTPDTLEGLYQHMLDGLDKSYMSEAFRYFGLLIASEELTSWGKPPRLLDLVLTESKLWDHRLRNDREYFTSPDFMRHCLRVETRILTRCAGLVEIEDHPITYIEGTYGYVRNPEVTSLGDPDYHEQEDRALISGDVPASSDGQNPSRHLRSVQLIHRTVKEFLQTHPRGFFQRPDERSAAAFALVRGKLGVMNLIPILVSQVKLGRMILTFFDVVKDIMDDLITLENSVSNPNID